MKNKSGKVGIDARMYGPETKGLGRYIQKIVDGVTAGDKANDYVIFLSKDNFHLFQSDNPRVKKVKLKSRWYSLAEQLELPKMIKREGIDLMHFPHFNVPVFGAGRFIVTIHDLILTKFPTPRASTRHTLFYWFKHFLYKTVIKSALKKALRVIAVSEFTKQDIVDQFRADPGKIEVVYEGVSSFDQGNKADDKIVLSRYNISEPYLLYVGNAYPHKNLEGLIYVFTILAERYEKLNLVLVGKSDYFYDRLKEIADGSQIADRIAFTGYVHDGELGSLYRQAEVYVFPSKYEGFGLPPLEAMANGCPVASSKAASLPEIQGEAALYFDPEDLKDMEEKIEKVMTDAKLREKLVARGYEQIGKYSWDKAVYQTMEIYKEVL